MKSSIHILRSFAVACIFMMIATCSIAQKEFPDKQYQPEVGQEGKDVVWVPTPQALVDKMLDLAKVTPDDYVIDLGSGDGRTVITAAKRGARALGIEYNPDMVALSNRNAEAEGVSDKATFLNADLFETDFSKATVITMFLLSSINLKLRPKILDLKPGTRIVSNTFDMGDWIPDEKANAYDTTDNTTDYSSTYDTALFWIVPAKVEGIWHMSQGELTLTQKFQMISGSINNAESVIPVENGRLRGDQISFDAGDAHYSGKVDGKVIEGVVTIAGTNSTWRATL
ncbi:MAG: methyltransferase domain-containing protein [Candidatus Latescibacteria bacterium]|nr:methyltransferase domain-containing protein [Candidatus Latescibacterota bacterium]